MNILSKLLATKYPWVGAAFGTCTAGFTFWYLDMLTWKEIVGVCLFSYIFTILTFKVYYMVTNDPNCSHNRQ